MSAKEQKNIVPSVLAKLRNEPKQTRPFQWHRPAQWVRASFVGGGIAALAIAHMLFSDWLAKREASG